MVTVCNLCGNFCYLLCTITIYKAYSIYNHIQRHILFMRKITVGSMKDFHSENCQSWIFVVAQSPSLAALFSGFDGYNRRFVFTVLE